MELFFLAHLRNIIYAIILHVKVGAFISEPQIVASYCKMYSPNVALWLKDKFGSSSVPVWLKLPSMSVLFSFSASLSNVKYYWEYETGFLSITHFKEEWLETLMLQCFDFNFVPMTCSQNYFWFLTLKNGNGKDCPA